jgi:hypothetical protein
MKSESMLRTRRYFACAIAALWTTLVLSGCRSDPPTKPTPNDWRLVLMTPDTFYRDTVSGHVPNDTIKVRVFNPEGNLFANAIIHSRAAISHDSITQAANSYSDTTTHWWGCNPPLIYWGSGHTANRDTIFSWAVVDADTVASASVSFEVRNP